MPVKQEKSFRPLKTKRSKKNSMIYRFQEQARLRKLILRLTAVVALIAFVFAGIWFIDFRQNYRGERPLLTNLELLPDQGSIEITAGERVVAQTDEAELYLDPETLNMRLFDKVNEIDWPLQLADENAAHSEKTIMNIEFLGENGELTEWNTYTYSVAGGNYDIRQLADGVRITLHVSQGASIRFDDYMPRRISIERYESLFLDELDRLRDDGEIDAANHAIFNLALQTAYRRNTEEGFYYLNYVGNPPTSTVNRLIQIAQAVDYTYEDLVSDNETYGITTETRENPEFSIPLELTLDGADLIARVSSSYIENRNAYYQLQSISLLPNFAIASAGDYPDGYMFVPDGSGALIDFNQADSNFPPYSRQFRDSNYYDTYYFSDNYSQKMSMPVFGMVFGGESSNEKAVLGIVEDGSVLAGVRAVQANTASDLAGTNINRIYSEIDLTQYARVNVYGPYTSGDTRYLVSTGMQDVNYQVRYKVLGHDADYYELAKAYQSHLLDNGATAGNELLQSMRAHLEFLGTIDMQKRFVGVPYDSKLSMTSYAQLSDILEGIHHDDLLITYKGALDGGYHQNLLREARLEEANGSADEWQTLQELSRSTSSFISPEANFSRAIGRQNGFVPGVHGITAFDTYTAYIYEYHANTGRFNADSYHYVRVSPWYWDSTITSFLEDEPLAEFLTIGDLTQDFFADYDENNPLSAYESEQILQGLLSELSSGYGLMLDNAFMDYIQYASFVSNVSRSSSNYSSFSTDIPFRQLVLNGLVPYSTETINMSRHSIDYFLLQVAETASLPQFTLTAESSERLKELSVSGFYSTQYSQHQEMVEIVLNEADQIRERIGSDRLLGHAVIGHSLYLSTYDNGTQVIVNYGDQTVDYEGREYESMSYTISGESEAN